MVMNWLGARNSIQQSGRRQKPVKRDQGMVAAPSLDSTVRASIVTVRSLSGGSSLRKRPTVLLKCARQSRAMKAMAKTTVDREKPAAKPGPRVLREGEGGGQQGAGEGPEPGAAAKRSPDVGPDGPAYHGLRVADADTEAGAGRVSHLA